MCRAKVLYVKGRQHPVKTYHTAVSQADYVDAAMRTFFQIHTDQPPGDVLIFLPGICIRRIVVCGVFKPCVGQEDIESLEKSIELYAKQLPADAMGVRGSSSSFYQSIIHGEKRYPGDDMSSFCRPCAVTAVQDFPANTQRHAEVHSRN